MPKDPLVAMANHTTAEWQKKMKEVERRKKQRKQQAWERGEETDSDDDDDNNEEEYDEVVTDIEWDNLGSKDALTGTHSSMQGPFPFHVREGRSVRLEEAG